MKKILSAAIIGLTAFGMYLFAGQGQKGQEVLETEALEAHSQQFNQFKLKEKQRKRLQRAVRAVREAKEDALEQIVSEIAFLEGIEETFKTEIQDEGVYAEAALYLLEYCQNLEPLRLGESKALRAKLVNILFNGEEVLKSRLRYVNEFLGDEAFICNGFVKAGLPDDDKILEQLKENCEDLDLIDTVRMSCAYALGEFTPCDEADYGVLRAKVYSKILVSYKDSPFLYGLEGCSYDVQLMGPGLKKMAEMDDIKDKVALFLHSRGYLEMVGSLEVPELRLR